VKIASVAASILWTRGEAFRQKSQAVIGLAGAVRDLWNFPRVPSLRLDVGGPDHLGPLFGVVGDELAEVGW
jgi:hypothetical protein